MAEDRTVELPAMGRMGAGPITEARVIKIPGPMAEIANWDEVSESTLFWRLHASDDITPEVGKALEEALNAAATAAGKAAVTAL